MLAVTQSAGVWLDDLLCDVRGRRDVASALRLTVRGTDEPVFTLSEIRAGDLKFSVDDHVVLVVAPSLARQMADVTISRDRRERDGGVILVRR